MDVKGFELGGAEHAEAGVPAAGVTTVRLHEGIGYVTPDNEHHGRGKAIRAARRAGLAAAHQQRLATNRQQRKDLP